MLPVDKFFFQVHAVNSAGVAVHFLGCAFSATPEGGFLTCRHVVNPGNLSDDLTISILDGEVFRPIDLCSIRYPKNESVDIAYIPAALGGPTQYLFPIIPADQVKFGLDVYTFGYFAFGGGTTPTVEPGYFYGRIVNRTTDTPGGAHGLTLPFPILEGMSGSPILHYRDGVKLIGIAYGNREMRIVQSSVIEYKDTEKQFTESINRITEFGLAYDSSAIIDAMREMGVEGTPITISRKSEFPWLD